MDAQTAFSKSESATQTSSDLDDFLQDTLALKPRLSSEILHEAEIARSYNRIALPNSLVEMLSSKDSLFPKLEGWLKGKSTGIDSSIFESIAAIYIRWNPRNETDQYSVNIFIMCDNEETQENFETAFRQQLDDLCKKDRKGFFIESLECQTKKETFVSQLDNYERLTEFDHLTNLFELHSLDIKA